VKTAGRIFRVLETGPRKTTVLRGLASSQEDFERAIGWLFLKGTVRWVGKKTGRMLARMG
jgi:hypothetical protein